MRQKTIRRVIWVAGVIPGAWLAGQASAPAAGAADFKTTEQVYKNIQVLKGVPADELVPAMQFITASLGVQCDFCHLENAFEKDDKEAKQTARKMIKMVIAANKDTFEGRQQVTCYACHRGGRKPVVTPTIEEENRGQPEHELLPDQPGANLPSADEVLRKYLQAIGGAEAAARVTSRVQKGTLTAGSKHFPVDVLAKPPAKRVTTIRLPGGDSITATNGDEGWLSTPGRGIHDMGPSELDGATLDAEIFFPGRLKLLFEELRVQTKEEVNGKDTYVVSGTRGSRPPAQLYFDVESGLLVRVLRFVKTPLGLNPVRIDYADYRQEDGVKTPFRWTVARPNARFTIQIEQMQQSIPIEDNRFIKPEASPPS
jgi:hypothetical protein